MNRFSDETSEALVAAAHLLLADHGPEALTVRRIANAAGMSTMNVYSRFGGKDGVIDELYADGYRRLLAEVEAVPIGDDAADELYRIAITYRSWALHNPRYYAIMFRQAIPGFQPSPESVDSPGAASPSWSSGSRSGRSVATSPPSRGTTPPRSPSGCGRRATA
jgi:AcrR family transcriptional regulator